MRLRFTPRAAANIEDIADYLHARNPIAARRVRSAIYESLQLLLVFPELGRRQKAEGIRKLITRRYGYLIFYVVDASADEIAIVSVKHPAERPEHSNA